MGGVSLEHYDGINSDGDMEVISVKFLILSSFIEVSVSNVIDDGKFFNCISFFELLMVISPSSIPELLVVSCSVLNIWAKLACAEKMNIMK